MDFQSLKAKLPLNAIVGGGEQMAIMIAPLTGDTQLTSTDSAIESLAKLLDAAYRVQQDRNAIREASGLEAITIVSRALVATESGNPKISYTLAIELDITASLDNLVG